LTRQVQLLSQNVQIVRTDSPKYEQSWICSILQYINPLPSFKC
jgi:hypothetical protein